jgi:Pyruvate/2-oxoacid:ferredoxin oxidoreductase delta subunit
MAGLLEAGNKLGFKIADFDKGRKISHPQALLIKSFVIANGVLDADGLINLPKLKSHPLTRLTGAVKNLFGCIPGLLKGQFHSKLPDPYDFSAMLVDISTLIKPRLCIMDGIMAMEGNGPRNGKIRQMNVLLFSEDPIALDATACRIVGMDPGIVPTALQGEKAGLGTYHSENIEIIVDKLESFIDNDFEIIRTAPDRCTTGKLRNYIKNRICDRPVIDNDKCNCCGTCVRLCPVEPKAINWRNGFESKPPVYNYDRCIRCFCCQENCPEGAISVKTTALSSLMARV